MGCGCDTGTGTVAAAAAGTGGFAIRLRNGNLVGRFGTEQQARHALNTTFQNAGTVVAR